MIAVKLNQGQKVLAYYEGLDRHKGYIDRQTQNTQHIHKTKSVSNDKNLQRQVLAVGAEIAVHNYFGLDFVAYSRPVADVGTNIEVRYSPRWQDLVVRPSDKDTHYAVLVYGDLDEYFIVGFMQVAQAKTFVYTLEQNCWWITQNNLRSMSDLTVIGDRAYERAYSL